jgi:hemolysin activation/secretion protein
MLCLLSQPVSAQVPPISLPTPFPTEPPPMPLPEEIRPTPPPSSVLPLPPPPPPPRKGAPMPLSVFVKEVRVTGSTVFTQQELATVTAPYTNRKLATEDLEDLRVKLTKFYIDRGYVTSGAIIPDQAIAEGIVTIQVIEGKLSRIDVEGNEWFRSGFLRDRVALGEGPPVNINALQERLLLLQETPGIARLNAELRPGLTRGESVLNVKVAEESPFKAWVEYNNFLSPTVGSDQGLATVAHRNLTGHGDVLSVQYGRSSGVEPIIDARYTIPLNARDTTLTVEFRKDDYSLIDSDFQTLDIKSKSDIYSLTVRHPVYRTLNREFALSLTGEYLTNTLTSAFDAIRAANPGLPGLRLVPGSQGAGGGETSSVSALRFSQEFTERARNQVIAVFSRLSVGLDVLGATNNKQSPTDASGKFFVWLGQAQWVRLLEPWRVQLIARVLGQLTDDRLFPLEQTSVGGRYSVRGYRENTLVRDNSVLASFETRISILRSAAGADILRLAPFMDYGRSWLAREPTPAPTSLASTGVGLIWDIMRGSRFEVYWGHRWNHIDSHSNNLQDHGVHLQLVVEAL